MADESQFSPFYYDKQITEEKILQAVRCGDFFGFLCCSVVATEKVREKFDSINFAPIFKKHHPKKEDLSEEMQKFFTKEPSNQLTVGYEVKDMMLASNLIKFYLSEGFIVKNVKWALHYQRGIFDILRLKFLKFEGFDLKF